MDHQAVAFSHRLGVGDAKRQLVLHQLPLAPLQRSERTALLLHPIPGMYSTADGVDVDALGGMAADAERLQVADVVRAALVPGEHVVHLDGPLMLMRAAALAAAPCPC